MKPETSSGPGRPDTAAARSPEVGERLERRVPPHAAAPTRRADRPRSVVQMLLRATAEVRERLLVRVEQLAQRLAQTRHVEAPPRVAERQHKDVPHLALRTPAKLALGPSQSGSLRQAASRTAYGSPPRATASPATAARTASPSRSCRRTAVLGAPGTEPGPSSRPRPPVAAGTPHAWTAACLSVPPAGTASTPSPAGTAARSCDRGPAHEQSPESMHPRPPDDESPPTGPVRSPRPPRASDARGRSSPFSSTSAPPLRLSR